MPILSTFLIAVTRKSMLRVTVRAHIKLRQAGAVPDLLVYDGVSHGDYVVVMDSPEFLHAYVELNTFLLKHLQ
ncbi:MAG: hypothetical protein WA996_20680 [Candidatus Promineifilaceae bacterium]